MTNRHHHLPFKSQMATVTCSQAKWQRQWYRRCWDTRAFQRVGNVQPRCSSRKPKNKTKQKKHIQASIYMRNLPAIRKPSRFLLLKLYNFFPFQPFGNSQWIELCFDIKKTQHNFQVMWVNCHPFTYRFFCPNLEVAIARDLPWTPFLRRALCSRSSFRVVSNKWFGGHGHGMVMETPVYPWPFIFTSKISEPVTHGWPVTKSAKPALLLIIQEELEEQDQRSIHTILAINLRIGIP